MSEDKGLKFDKQKTMHELVPPFAQEQYARVLTFGARKYSPHNWERGMKWSRIIGAIKRHTLAIERGEDYDPETGLLHSAHLMCEAGFLTEYYKIFPQGDDRESEIMRGYRIGLDIDDVLSDFCPAFCKRYGLEEPRFWMFDRNIAAKFEELAQDREFWTLVPGGARRGSRTRELGGAAVCPDKYDRVLWATRHSMEEYGQRLAFE